MKYVDPDGRAAWDDILTWDSSMEDTFRENFVKNATNIVLEAQRNGNIIDCADVALTAFINTAADMGLSVTFEVYNSDKRKYESISSNDDSFNSRQEFLDYVKTNMGAINLLDWRTTKDIDKPKKGDLVMFDLRSDNSPDYQGHTIVVLTDPKNNTVYTVQGHLDQPPTSELYTLGYRMYGGIPQYKRFRYEEILK